MKPLIFAGSSNPLLAQAIADEIGTPLAQVELGRFNDGETRVKINQTVRGQNVFILQSTCKPVNDNLMEILLMADAMRRSSAEKIIAVIPYYGYSRQDYQMAPREPISARVVGDLLSTSGVTNIVSVDVHSSKTQGFFTIPFDNLHTSRIACDFLTQKVKLKAENTVIVSPDAGGVKRAQYFSSRLATPIAIIHKRRPKPGESKVTHLVGEVDGRDCLIVDDMVDTGGSLLNAAQTLKDQGARSVYAYCTHPVLSGDAVSNIEKSKALTKLIVTDTIPVAGKTSKIVVCSMAPTLAKVIQAIHDNKSISPYVD